jgi:hypothetical protein
MGSDPIVVIIPAMVAAGPNVMAVSVGLAAGTYGAFVCCVWSWIRWRSGR